MSLDNVQVETDRQEFTDAAILAVEVGTTGPEGGDAGHGGRTVLLLENLGATSWEVEVDGNRVEHPEHVRIVVGGDAEGSNLIQALEYAALRLRQHWSGRG